MDPAMKKEINSGAHNNDPSVQHHEGTFTDKPLSSAGGRQEALHKMKEGWNENIVDPVKRAFGNKEAGSERAAQKEKHIDIENREHAADCSGLKHREGLGENNEMARNMADPNIVNPTQLSAEKGTSHGNFPPGGDSSTSKIGQQNYHSGVENKPMVGGINQGPQFH